MSSVRWVLVALSLGSVLLLGGCVSHRVHTAGQPEERHWVWCDRVQQDRPTVLCVQQ